MDECNLTPAQAAISNANLHFVHAFVGRNIDEVANCYTKGGWLFPAHAGVMCGRLAIQSFWQGVLDMGLCCTERKAVELWSTATIGHEIGTYVLRQRNGQLADQGIYITLWQSIAGRWQIHCDIWRSSGADHR